MTLSWQQVLSHKYQYQYQQSKYQYKYQYLACKYKYKYQYPKIELKCRSSTSTSTQYKTGWWTPGRSIHNILLSQYCHHSLAEERPTNPTSISRLRQFQTVSSQIVSGICEFEELSRIDVFFASDYFIGFDEVSS